MFLANAAATVDVYVKQTGSFFKLGMQITSLVPADIWLFAA